MFRQCHKLLAFLFSPETEELTLNSNTTVANTILFIVTAIICLQNDDRIWSGNGFKHIDFSGKTSTFSRKFCFGYR